MAGYVAVEASGIGCQCDWDHWHGLAVYAPGLVGSIAGSVGSVVGSWR